MTQPASPKILLAEDDNDMRRFLVKALENAGYEVIDYDNGMSAYRRLREEPFELLLTDIVMPEMDGIELARRAAGARPRHQDHVHHRLRGGRAQCRLQGPEGRQSAVQAVPPARPRQRGAEDADGGLSAVRDDADACPCRSEPI
jgi:CheY-like chemotaxis protein